MKNALVQLSIPIILFILHSCLEEPKNEGIDKLSEKEKVQNLPQNKETSYVLDTILPEFIALKELPKSTLIKDDTIHWGGGLYITHKEKTILRSEVVPGISKLYEHNYAFDTTIYNCKMRLVVHRLSEKKNIEQLMLDEVNNLIVFLVKKSPFINELNAKHRPKDEPCLTDMGDYSLYLDLEGDGSDSLSCRGIYSFWSGGGSSLKKNELKSIRPKEFKKLLTLSLSSNTYFNYWNELEPKIE